MSLGERGVDAPEYLSKFDVKTVLLTNRSDAASTIYMLYNNSEF